ncbi:MAG TPA: type II toxin-antitoxin system HicA family toxin [Thermoanaerobaculia bacterium]
MVRLPRISGDQAVRVLRKLGFTVVRQRGSHVVLRKETDDGATGCVVPLHDELSIGTLHGILQQANVKPADFLAHL